MKKKIIIGYEGEFCDTFKNSAHYTRFDDMLDYISGIYGAKDCTRLDSDLYAVAYLISLDPDLYAHRAEIISAEDYANQINPAAVLYSEWITEESKQTMRLLLHLYSFGEYDTEINPAQLTPSALFNTVNSPYYMQAVRLAYPAYNQAQPTKLTKSRRAHNDNINIIRA